MTATPPRSSDLFRTVGAWIYARMWRLVGDDAEAMRAAEALFVRFVVYRRDALDDAPRRWAWIYRVATSHALRSLPALARPGGAAVVSGLPTMQSLRAFDEATQNVVILTELDRLSEAEVAEVLGLAPELVRRKLTAWRAGAAAGARGIEPPVGAMAHPSRLALDRDRAVEGTTRHLATCASCRALVEDADRVTAQFGERVTEATLGRVADEVRAERARLTSGPRWKRIFWLGSAFVFVTVMAFVVARPRATKTQMPFRGLGSASRAKASGLQVTVRRGTDVGALAPEVISRLGDRFHFRVRGEAPRYLEVRARGPRATVRIFPAGDATSAALVTPGQALDHDYVLDAPAAQGGHTLIVEGLFADHPFQLDRPPGPDIEVVPVRVEVEP